MLASLLPGLREVRTPLTVGYLWLLFIWLAFADKMPTERPASDNLIARWFDLSGMLERPATLAALSFLAYVIGAIFTVPTEGPRTGSFLRQLNLRAPWSTTRSSEYSATEHSFVIFVSEEILKVRGALGAPHFTGDDTSVVAAKNGMINHVEWARKTPLPSLRSRLLVASQEVYGEYDRFAAEGNFGSVLHR